MYVSMYVSMYVCMCVCMYVCVYVCMYVCMYELPTLVLYRKHRFKPAFPAGLDSVSPKHYQSQAHISRDRVCVCAYM